MALQNNLDLNTAQKSVVKDGEGQKSTISSFITTILILWLLFAGNVLYLGVNFNNIPEWSCTG